MPLQAVDSRRLYRQIADQIAALIERHEYAVGARLPPERDLAKQLGVSRPSVREALIALEVEGYVEVRVGSGVYVVGPQPGAATARELSTDSGPFELIRARWLIEAECAAMAAKAATRAQLRAMEQALERMEKERKRGVMPLDADRDFHLRIAEACGNSALALVVKTLWDQRTGPLFLRLEHHFDTPDLWEHAIREHRDIVGAIARHDATGARAAMRRHMNQAGKRFSISWEQSRQKR
ncbi:MAG TPA: FadR/GntR family transcriptional regulator [Usitatibacter sp.]|jgi:DNA-binding FadR family transcriptional regulator|nr:FadR/GntR family transcriptional regulator [Usitatibacter sp.]